VHVQKALFDLVVEHGKRFTDRQQILAVQDQ
jgi:hypothetical protein